MKISVTIAILAIAVAVGAMGVVTTIQMAHAAPTEPHGTCNGAGGGNRCAGNLGGFQENRGTSRCINNGPFNEFC